MTNKPVPLIIKFEDWPEVDRRLWQDNTAAGGLFDSAGLFSHWSSGTQRLHRQGYGSWLSFLARTRLPLVDQDPEDRVNEETVRAYVEESLARLKPRSIANHLTSLVIVMRGFAPGRDWSWLSHAANTMLTRSTPDRLKKPLPLTASDIFGSALNRLQALDQRNPIDTRTAAQFRVALTIAFLIAVPVRARSFVAMTVSKHIEVLGNGFMLHFGKNDVKTRRDMRFELPEQLVCHFKKYLQVYRPLLLAGRESDALWISERGVRLSQDSLTSGLACATERTFGQKLRPHAFRHIAATSIAEDDPEHVGIIREILGHATLRMAEMHYNRATAVNSSRRMQEIVRQLRRRSVSARSPRPRQE